MAAFSNTSGIPTSMPEAFSRSYADRAPERIRRHHQRPHHEEQALLLRQLRRIPVRLGHRSRVPDDTDCRRADGGFQRFLPTSGTNGVVYDPTSATGTGVRTPFPNNIIPANRISSISQSFQSYLPPPTNGSLTNNYLATLPNKVNNDSTTDKVDYSLTDKNRLFALFSTGKYANPVVGSLTPVSTSTLSTPYTDGRGVIEYSTTAQIHDSQIISSSLINQFSASLSRMFIPLTSNTYGGNYPSKAGLKGLPGGVAGSGFPDITFSGGTNAPVSWDGTNSHAYNEAQNTFDVQDNVLWTKGKHNLTFGFQWQSLQDNENTPLTGTQAGFTFSNS